MYIEYETWNWNKIHIITSTRDCKVPATEREQYKTRKIVPCTVKLAAPSGDEN